MGVEQGAQGHRVPLPRRIEQLPVQRQRIDVGLERTPAGEPVPPGDLELRVGQSRRRVSLAQLVEPALGLLAKPVEVGSIRRVT